MDKNPALVLFEGWKNHLHLYNQFDDFDARLNSVIGEMDGHLASRYADSGILRPYVERYMTLAPISSRGQVGIALLYGNNNRVFEVTTDGKIRFHWNNRHGWNILSRHTFIGYQRWRGDALLSVRPQAGSAWGWDPWDVQERRPYCNGRHLNGTPYYHLFQDERNFWRIGLSFENNDDLREDVIEGLAESLRTSYDRSDRLYRLRRSRKFAEAKVLDPEARRPLIIQQPDALAKAFTPYRPAPVAFPEPRPMEAVHG